MRSSTVTLLGAMVLVIGACTAAEPAANTTTPSPSPSTTAVSTVPQSSLPPPSTMVPPPQVEPSADIQNLGLAARWTVALSDGVAVGVVESNQGTNLSADGDQSDVIAHVVTGDDVVNTGLHAPWGVKPLASSGFVVEIDERDTGVDLTGDGDLEDQVPHIWTIAEGVRNLEVSGFAAPRPDGGLWVEVYEAGEGRDLNNDGDIGYEHVVHSWDPDRGWHNTGWAAGSLTPLTDGTVILGVFEEEQGGSDFNGDGAADGHFAVWLGPDEHRVIGPAYTVHALDDDGALISFEDTSAGGLSREWGLTIWHPDRDAVVLDILTVNHRSIPGGGAYFRVAEGPDYWNYQTACETGQDLSGDGDCEDFVLHLWTPDRGLANLGLADWWCPECDWGYVGVGTTAFVSVPQDPGSGEEADGDEEHSVLHIVDDGDVTALEVIPTTATTTWAVLDDGVILTAGPDNTFTFVGVDGTATDLGLSGYAAYPLAEGATLLGDEGMSGRDLNGDGEITEGTLVAHTWQPDSGVANLGLTVARFESELEGMRPVPPVELPGTGRLVVLVPEGEHGAGDLNGDGDLNDAAVHLVHIPPPTDVSLRGDGLGVAPSVTRSRTRLSPWRNTSARPPRYSTRLGNWPRERPPRGCPEGPMPPRSHMCGAPLGSQWPSPRIHSSGTTVSSTSPAGR